MFFTLENKTLGDFAYPIWCTKKSVYLDKSRKQTMSKFPFYSTEVHWLVNVFCTCCWTRGGPACLGCCWDIWEAMRICCWICCWCCCCCCCWCCCFCCAYAACCMCCRRSCARLICPWCLPGWPWPVGMGGPPTIILGGCAGGGGFSITKLPTISGRKTTPRTI